MTNQQPMPSRPANRALRARVEALEPRLVLAVITVDTLFDGIVDDGFISLSEAVQAANYDVIADPTEGIQGGDGDDVIRFDASLIGGQIAVQSDLFILDTLAIEGPGIDALRISSQFGRGYGVRIDSESARRIDVAIRDIDFSLRTESVENVSVEKARIYPLTISDSVDVNIDDVVNLKLFVDAESAHVTVANVATSDEDATSQVNFSSPHGSLTISDSEFANNSNGYSGQFYGIFAETADGVVTIARTSVSGFVERGVQLNATDGAEFNIVDSLITDNGSIPLTGQGGGVRFGHNFDEAKGSLRIVNTTISGNLAIDGGGVAIRLGGDDTFFSLTNSTIANNTAYDFGGGLIESVPFFGDAQIHIANSLLTGNVSQNGMSDLSIRPTSMTYSIASYSYLYSDPTVFGPGNLLGTPATGALDVLLEPLADNGGPTHTHAVGPLSIATNAGDPVFVPTGPGYDQRGSGFSRIVGGRVDVGAYEFQANIGDFHEDGILDCLDVNALNSAISAGSTDGRWDINLDGQVDVEDIHTWVTEVFGTFLGDANLDGIVDVSDFNVWNSNRFQMSARWCDGDFNADGVVDTSDFNIWNQQKLQSVFETSDNALRPRSSVRQLEDRPVAARSSFEEIDYSLKD